MEVVVAVDLSGEKKMQGREGVFRGEGREEEQGKKKMKMAS